MAWRVPRPRQILGAVKTTWRSRPWSERVGGRVTQRIDSASFGGVGSSNELSMPPAPAIVAAAVPTRALGRAERGAGLACGGPVRALWSTAVRQARDDGESGEGRTEALRGQAGAEERLKLDMGANGDELGAKLAALARMSTVELEHTDADAAGLADVNLQLSEADLTAMAEWVADLPEHEQQLYLEALLKDVPPEMQAMLVSDDDSEATRGADEEEATDHTAPLRLHQLHAHERAGIAQARAARTAPPQYDTDEFQEMEDLMKVLNQEEEVNAAAAADGSGDDDDDVGVVTEETSTRRWRGRAYALSTAQTLYGNREAAQPLEEGDDAEEFVEEEEEDEEEMETGLEASGWTLHTKVVPLAAEGADEVPWDHLHGAEDGGVGEGAVKSDVNAGGGSGWRETGASPLSRPLRRPKRTAAGAGAAEAEDEDEADLKMVADAEPRGGDWARDPEVDEAAGYDTEMGRGVGREREDTEAVAVAEMADQLEHHLELAHRRDDRRQSRLARREGRSRRALFRTRTTPSSPHAARTARGGAFALDDEVDDDEDEDDEQGWEGAGEEEQHVLWNVGDARADGHAHADATRIDDIIAAIEARERGVGAQVPTGVIDGVRTGRGRGRGSGGVEWETSTETQDRDGGREAAAGTGLATEEADDAEVERALAMQRRRAEGDATLDTRRLGSGTAAVGAMRADIRRNRIAHAVHKALLDILDYGRIPDDRVSEMVIERVEMSRDLRTATVWYSRFDDSDSPSPAADRDLQHALARSTKAFRSQLVQRARFRSAPVLVFRRDMQAAETARIDELLRKAAADMPPTSTAL